MTKFITIKKSIQHPLKTHQYKLHNSISSYHLIRYKIAGKIAKHKLINHQTSGSSLSEQKTILIYSNQAIEKLKVLT
jgi:hypothetical protein